MGKLAITEKSMPVFEYLKENDGKALTAEDIAIGMGFAEASDEEGLKAATKSVNAMITAGLQRKGYTQRVEAEITLEDGTHRSVKLIELTDAGRAYDHDAAVKADVEAAMSKSK